MPNQKEDNRHFLRNVFIKGTILFLIFNLVFAWLGDSIHPGEISGYNWLFPGRERFPFGENPAEAYNFSLYDFDAMFASHEYFSNASTHDTFDVVIIGDSSVWGTLLKPEETISGQLNNLGLKTCDGTPIHFYNLGYPSLSLTKDLVILDKALEKSPGLILWFVTLESFPEQVQYSTPILLNNPSVVKSVLAKYHLEEGTENADFVETGFWDKTIIGNRRSLADLVRLQLYGVMWAATGIDQYYPENYTSAQHDLDADPTFHGWSEDTNLDDYLAWDVLDAGITLAGKVPVVIINEPILRSSGLNSDIRYDYYYPRWAYDSYRLLLQEKAAQMDWYYVDLWDITSEDEFTNSAIHMTPAATGNFSQQVWVTLNDLICTMPDE